MKSAWMFLLGWYCAVLTLEAWMWFETFTR